MQETFKQWHAARYRQYKWKFTPATCDKFMETVSEYQSEIENVLKYANQLNPMDLDPEGTQSQPCIITSLTV